MRGTPADTIKRKIGYLIFFIAVFLLLSFVVQFLWNALLPQVVHVSAITYRQALGLMLLCRILFGNFHFGGKNWDRQNAAHLKNKLMSMDEDDRAAFKEEWNKRTHRS